MNEGYLMLRRVFVSLVASFALTGCVLYAPIDLGSLGGPGELRETLVEGTTGPKIVLVDITGEISDAEERSNFAFAQRPSIVAETKNVLDRAAADDDVVALLLRINSPGGSVSASDTLYHEIKAWKDENKKPVFAYFNGISASGAYYTAMAADHIVAHPACVTGSIGVIMPGLSIEGLMEKYGVADQTLTSGPYKDAGSMFRDMRPDERKQLQSVIDDLYHRFTSVVALGRPGLDAAKIHTLADGRVYSADQALAAGLVDELGYLDDTVAAIQKQAGIKESRVVVYHRSNSVRENIYSRAMGAPDLSLQALELGLASLRRSALAPGFYYLWPAALTP
jgi:protease-4